MSRDGEIVRQRGDGGASERAGVADGAMEARVSAADGTELAAVGEAEVAADEAIVSGEVAAVADELMVIGVAIEPDVGDDANELEELRLITCGIRSSKVHLSEDGPWPPTRFRV